MVTGLSGRLVALSRAGCLLALPGCEYCLKGAFSEPRWTLWSRRGVTGRCGAPWIPAEGTALLSGYEP
jgi:hypothetical protein